MDSLGQSRPARVTPMERAQLRAAMDTLVQQFWVAWFVGNARAMTRLFAESAVLVTPTGRSQVGRLAIEKAFQEMLETGRGNSRIARSVNIDFLRRDTAVAVIERATRAFPSSVGPVWTEIWVIAACPETGEWRFVAVHMGVPPLTATREQLRGPAGRHLDASSSAIDTSGLVLPHTSNEGAPRHRPCERATTDRVHAEVAVRQTFHGLSEAYRLGDMAAFAACFSSEATLLLPDGRCLRGGDAIHHALKTTWRRRPHCTVSALYVTHVADGAAVISVVGHAHADQAYAHRQWHSTWTAIHTAAGTWKIVSGQLCATPEHRRRWYACLLRLWPKFSLMSLRGVGLDAAGQ